MLIPDQIAWIEWGPAIDDYLSGAFNYPFGPPVPPPASVYSTPRRHVEDEDDLIVMRFRENKACSLFRQDGFRMRCEMYRSEKRVEALNYLWERRLANNHIPIDFLMNGTLGHEEPIDALLAAVVEDVSLGDPGDENYIFG